MQNIRNTKVHNPTGVMPLEEQVKEIIYNMQNPINEKKVIEGDGGAWRAYNFQLLKPHKTS